MGKVFCVYLNNLLYFRSIEIDIQHEGVIKGYYNRIFSVQLVDFPLWEIKEENTLCEEAVTFHYKVGTTTG